MVAPEVRRFPLGPQVGLDLHDAGTHVCGKTSWDQYLQVFEATVSSNGWDGITAALQLVSHLKGDDLNVALLVPHSSNHRNAPKRK